MGINKYKKDLLIGLISIITSFILLIILRYIPILWILGLIVLSYLISIFFFGKAFLFDIDDTQSNPLKSWKFSHRYYSSLGYSLFTGGFVAMVTISDKIPNSIGIIIAGITLIVVGELDQNKIEKFEESIKK